MTIENISQEILGESKKKLDNKKTSLQDTVLKTETLEVRGKSVPVVTKRDVQGNIYKVYIIDGVEHIKKPKYGASVLDINPELLDKNYHYRWVNEIGNKVAFYESEGYTIVSDKNINNRVEASKTIASQKQVLMRKPKEMVLIDQWEQEEKRQKQLQDMKRRPQTDKGFLDSSFIVSDETNFAVKKQKLEDM
jgi:hypothetical protein